MHPDDRRAEEWHQEQAARRERRERSDNIEGVLWASTDGRPFTPTSLEPAIDTPQIVPQDHAQGDRPMATATAYLIRHVCVECGKTHHELTDSPDLAGALVKERCPECVQSHETADWSDDQ